MEGLKVVVVGLQEGCVVRLGLSPLHDAELVDGNRRRSGLEVDGA